MKIALGSVSTFESLRQHRPFLIAIASPVFAVAALAFFMAEQFPASQMFGAGLITAAVLVVFPSMLTAARRNVTLKSYCGSITGFCACLQSIITLVAVVGGELLVGTGYLIVHAALKMVAVTILLLAAYLTARNRSPGVAALYSVMAFAVTIIEYAMYGHP